MRSRTTDFLSSDGGTSAIAVKQEGRNGAANDRSPSCFHAFQINFLFGFAGSDFGGRTTVYPASS